MRWRSGTKIPVGLLFEMAEEMMDDMMIGWIRQTTFLEVLAASCPEKPARWCTRGIEIQTPGRYSDSLPSYRQIFPLCSAREYY